jgi:type III restriction enzyme
MDNRFFEKPILNSPYEYPARHWELDDQGQPTQQIIERRRRAEFITPIPKPKKRKKSAHQQQQFVFDEGKGLSTQEQQYDPTPIINELRRQVDQWRKIPNPDDWKVTPETARLLQHWRHHRFNNLRPFFCQVEAIETAIWLTEVASKIGKSGDALDMNFRNMASDEIERFRREIIERTGDRRQAENISDQDLLREVMNTVGKEGDHGDLLGARCKQPWQIWPLGLCRVHRCLPDRI